MFSELTDEEIRQFKMKVTEFLQNNLGTSSVSSSFQGMSFTINHQNAWKTLEELTKEQSRRRRGNNPFVALDLRNA